MIMCNRFTDTCYTGLKSEDCVVKEGLDGLYCSQVSGNGQPGFREWTARFQGMDSQVSGNGQPGFREWTARFQGMDIRLM
jgi:hypothetical protein